MKERGREGEEATERGRWGGGDRERETGRGRGRGLMGMGQRGGEDGKGCNGEAEMGRVAMGREGKERAST